MRIAKVLVANRGEIAVRVIRACREQAIASVDGFSEADREALHVQMADEAYPIGPPAPNEIYVAIDKLVRVAKAAGPDAVHPGYGFLAENAAFAEACAVAGLVFIGPPAQAIRSLGDKTAARRIARELGVPTVPGTFEPVAGEAAVRAAAREIGYPLMIKASMGGGGKGMRAVHAESELLAALGLAQSEAAYSFGDAAVYLERFLLEPRHIEVQVLADAHGHVVHLGERECSIQRRHQKLVEESPSPFVDAAMRGQLGEAACGTILASMRATRCRASTTPCSLSSSCGAPTGRPPSSGWRARSASTRWSGSSRRSRCSPRSWATTISAPGGSRRAFSTGCCRRSKPNETAPDPSP